MCGYVQLKLHVEYKLNLANVFYFCCSVSLNSSWTWFRIIQLQCWTIMWNNIAILLYYYFFLNFLTLLSRMWILVLQLRIKPTPSAVHAQNPTTGLSEKSQHFNFKQNDSLYCLISELKKMKASVCSPQSCLS